MMRVENAVRRIDFSMCRCFSPHRSRICSRGEPASRITPFTIVNRLNLVVAPLLHMAYPGIDVMLDATEEIGFDAVAGEHFGDASHELLGPMTRIAAKCDCQVLKGAIQVIRQALRSLADGVVI